MDGKTMLYSAKCRVDLHRKHFSKGATSADIKLLDDVQELISLAYQAGREAAESISPEVTSNNASLGYAIMAAEKVGIEDGNIDRLVRAMRGAHDAHSVEEAAEHYRCSPY